MIRKILRKCGLACCCLLLSTGLWAQSPGLDFHAANIPLEEALLLLSQQSGIDIAFNPKILPQGHAVEIDVENTPLREIINQMLVGTGLTHKEMKGRILLLKRPKRTYTCSGYVSDAETGERLVAASIYSLDNPRKGTNTNEYGFYSLTLEEGENQLAISYLGYEQAKLKLESQQDQRQDIQLAVGELLTEVVVTPSPSGTDASNHLSLSHQHLPQERIRSLPGLGGLADPIRTAQLLPSVQSADDGVAGITVRGGDSNQNLMLLDGVPIYIPYHLLGFFSVYNPAAVHSAQVFTGSFPARYGGRLSSIFDIRIREGNRQRWSAEASANLMSVDALVEGPFAKGKGSMLLAGRSSHSSFLLGPYFKETFFTVKQGGFVSQFQDLNAKINYSISKEDQLYISLYHGRDAMLNSFWEEEEDEETDSEIFTQEEVDINWSNTTAALRWNRIHSQHLFSNTTITYSAFTHEYGTLLEYFEEIPGEDEDEDMFRQDFQYYDFSSDNQEWGLRTDFNYLPSTAHHLRFGGTFTTYRFAPSVSFIDEAFLANEDLEDEVEIDLDELDAVVEGNPMPAHEASLYLEDKVSLGDWQLNLGLRAGYFHANEKGYFRLEPRFSASRRFPSNFQAELSASRMVQQLHLLSFSDLRLPNDLWIPSGNGIQPADSWQTEMGFSYLPWAKTRIGLAGYAKWMSNLYSYSPGLENIEDFSESLPRGRGWASGLELSIEHQGERFGGMVGYTYGQSRRRFVDVGNGSGTGDSFTPAMFHPHQVKLFAYHRWGESLRLTANWQYNAPAPTGNLIRLGEELEEWGNTTNRVSDERYAYHRLDVALQYDFRTWKLSHSLHIGAYNLYDRNNIAYHRLSQNQQDQIIFRPVQGLGFRPSLRYQIRF